MLSADLFWQLVGIAAAALTTFAYIPQIIKVWRSKSARAISLPTLLQLTAGVSLWMVYGFYLHNAILAGANLITLITLFILIGLYFVYRKE